MGGLLASGEANCESIHIFVFGSLSIPFFSSLSTAFSMRSWTGGRVTTCSYLHDARFNLDLYIHRRAQVAL